MSFGMDCACPSVACCGFDFHFAFGRFGWLSGSGARLFCFGPAPSPSLQAPFPRRQIAAASRLRANPDECPPLASERGILGGYFLAKDASDIRLGDIIRLFDGTLAPIRCASQSDYRACDDCVDEATCPVHNAMFEVRNAIASVLDGRTLAQVAAAFPKRQDLTDQRSVGGQFEDVSIDNHSEASRRRGRGFQPGSVESRKGCDHGQCGACTVLVDGRRINSCLTFAGHA